MRSFRESCLPAIPQQTDLIVLIVINRPSHMKELFRLCKSKTVVWKELPYGDHNSSVAEPGYFNYIDEFIWRNVLGG
jgi:hypothetical protein